MDAIPGIGCRLQKRLFDAYGSAQAILAASQGPGLSVEGIGRARALAIGRIGRIDRFDRVARAGTDVGGDHQLKTASNQAEPDRPAIGRAPIDFEAMVGYADSSYSKLLREISDPPPYMWFQGDVNCLNHKCVSIVGTRRASAYGRRTAHRLAFELASAGITIVSGLAYGIDRAAHEGALDAGGKTVAVLGSGINQIYPRSHRALASQIVDSGCLISEFEPETMPDPTHFPQRNRIISGLSTATIVVEAFEKAGALITAGLCIDQKRDLYAVPGRIEDETSIGTNALLASSAAQLIFSSEQVLSDLGLTQTHISVADHQRQRLSQTSGVPRSQLEQNVLDSLSKSAKHMDDLNFALDFPGPELWSVILKLECDGEIRALEGNRYERVLKRR